MIKTVLHYVCFVIAGILWIIFLALILKLAMLIFFKIDPFSPATYSGIINFWNNGGVLTGKDVLMFLICLLCLPLCFYGIRKLYKYQYIRLITTPLNKIMNHGLNDYVAPEVNIKNLKIEEKKTLEQAVQERLAEEKKKNKQAANAGEFRKNIIEKIETRNKK